MGSTAARAKAILFGGIGDDYLDGGCGRDRAMGSDGNDTFFSTDSDIGRPVLRRWERSLAAGDDDDLLTSIDPPTLRMPIRALPAR